MIPVDSFVKMRAIHFKIKAHFLIPQNFMIETNVSDNEEID